jgi:Ala-tRNA(Pro) deacylase
MSVCTRLRELLDAEGLKYVVTSHSQAFTAQEVAQRLHVSGREMAKTVVLRTAGGLALAVVRAPDRVDLERAGAILGEDVSLASEREFERAFPDCEMGAMPPFGNLYGLPTLVDEELAKDQEIVFNAGTHTDAIRMAFRDFTTAAQPRLARVSESTAPAGR